MAKRFKQESLKTLGFCNRNDQHSDALKDKNNVVDGATLAISSHSSTATLHGGDVFACINGSGTVFWTGLNAHSLQHGTQFRRDR